MIQNVAAAHHHFSAEFFNLTWELIEKEERSSEGTERMISMSHASLAHWRMRHDCTARNLSIGYWQLSRVYAVAGQADNASHYGQLCLELSGQEPPFYIAYAHESLGRAAKLKGDKALLDFHLAEAGRWASQVSDPEEKKMLDDDLDRLSLP